jgi:hypothetical protein
VHVLIGGIHYLFHIDSAASTVNSQTAKIISSRLFAAFQINFSLEEIPCALQSESGLFVIKFVEALSTLLPPITRDAIKNAVNIQLDSQAERLARYKK